MSDHDAAVRAASLLASRLCHDLVNPIGALSTGLEVLAEGGDADLEAHAMALIKESAAKSVALLQFARLAFGSSGSLDGELDMSDCRSAAEDLYKHAKAKLVWDVSEPRLPKYAARVLMNLLLIAERTAPRDGSEVIASVDGGVTVTARGPKIKCSEALERALSGDETGLEAKEMPAYLAAMLAVGARQRIETTYQQDEELRMRMVSL